MNYKSTLAFPNRKSIGNHVPPKKGVLLIEQLKVLINQKLWPPEIISE
jgi:hypothetical protein